MVPKTSQNAKKEQCSIKQLRPNLINLVMYLGDFLEILHHFKKRFISFTFSNLKIMVRLIKKQLDGKPEGFKKNKLLPLKFTLIQ